MNPTVLLVHGAMHTPWIFDPLRARLTARGIATAAVQLPSSNPDSASTGGLADDAATIRSVIEAIEPPVVLAAHSYGGVPAPVVDAVREVVPFSARSRTRARTLERARALSRERSLARLTPVPATLRERVLQWATGSQVLDVAVPAGSMRIVVAPMGSGKSEIAESWWRDGLREAEHDEAIEVPVWIEARQASARGLEQSVIDAIGGDPIRPCRVVVDDLEGVGAAEARLLLKQARQLAAASLAR